MGMTKFIKLTNAEAPHQTVYVNFNFVTDFRTFTGATVLSQTTHFDGEHDYVRVAETPEQILALIEGPTGEYEPSRQFDPF